MKYQNVVVFDFGMNELFAVYGKERDVISTKYGANALGIGQHEQLSGIFDMGELGLELSEQIAVDGVHENGSLLRSTDDQAELAADYHADDLSYVTGQNGARTRILVGRVDRREVLVDHVAFHAVPDPDHDGGVARAGCYKAVAVGGHLRAIDARDQIVVAVDDLNDFGRVGGEHAKALVEESRRQQESYKQKFQKINFK